MKWFGTFQDPASMPAGPPGIIRYRPKGIDKVCYKRSKWSSGLPVGLTGFDWTDSGSWSYPKADSRYERKTIKATKPLTMSAAA